MTRADHPMTVHIERAALSFGRTIPVRKPSGKLIRRKPIWLARRGFWAIRDGGLLDIIGVSYCDDSLSHFSTSLG